jgi:hypothetical protein
MERRMNYRRVLNDQFTLEEQKTHLEICRQYMVGSIMDTQAPYEVAGVLIVNKMFAGAAIIQEADVKNEFYPLTGIWWFLSGFINKPYVDQIPGYYSINTGFALGERWFKRQKPLVNGVRFNRVRGIISTLENDKFRDLALSPNGRRYFEKNNYTIGMRGANMDKVFLYKKAEDILATK